VAYISKLNLSKVRSHDGSTFKFDKFMNAIVGPNGSGKTTILESLYVLSKFSSFKGSLVEMVKVGQDSLSASIDINNDSTNHSRALKILKSNELTQKKWTIDNKKYARPPIAERLPLVLFEPNLSSLITGSPTKRRTYIDSIASQLNFEVEKSLIRYDRIIIQRNKLLKTAKPNHKSSISSQLFVYNTQLAHESENIIKARTGLLEVLQKDISTYYKQLGGNDEISIKYRSPTIDDPTVYAATMLKQLESNIDKDILLGFTSVGPHRDDVIIEINSVPAILRASRGEVRTIVIALKLLETAIISDHSAKYGMKPTLLLDDVLSELDLTHQEKVLDGLKDHQVFITTTDAHALIPGVHTIFLE
jgi:DNA replication and repair protein RecF